MIIFYSPAIENPKVTYRNHLQMVDVRMGKIMIGSKPSQCFFHSQTRMATDILSWLKLLDQMVSFMAGLPSGN